MLHLRYPHYVLEQGNIRVLSKIENKADVSAYPWTCWEKLTFDQSFLSDHKFFSFENCCLPKKRRSKVMEIFRKLVVGGKAEGE